MARHQISVNISKGQITNKKAVRILFESLKDGRWTMDIHNERKRSNPLNRYYWGYVVPTVQTGIKDLGTELTLEEVHSFLKARFNYTEIVNEATGECERFPRSTSALSNVQFIEYYQKIQRFCAEFLNVIMLDPNEELTLEYK